MTLATAAAYWNQGVVNVPVMTGAATVMDCADIRDVLEHMGIAVPLGAVLDIGCGTGRLRQLAGDRYHGCDIAKDAIDYCTERFASGGRPGEAVSFSLIQHGPCCLPAEQFDWFLCLSVFTHISRDERRAYLMALRTRSKYSGWADGGPGTQLLVDVIPGDGAGEISLWTADVAEFEADLTVSGWVTAGVYSRTSPDGPTHRYYHLRRRS